MLQSNMLSLNMNRLQSNVKIGGGIQIGDFQGLRAYLNAALKRCGCELDPDRRDEIEEFLFQEYWLKEKPIPTKIVIKGREIKDPAVKWALREKLKDIHFQAQTQTISSICNEDGEEVDIFECIGEIDARYIEIEQWHDICATIGAEPARALLFSLYDSTEDKEQERQKWEQGVLF